MTRFISFSTMIIFLGCILSQSFGRFTLYLSFFSIIYNMAMKNEG